ncbi:MAG: SDR family oxidoreductase [Smithellaceae bacterium]|nr:SDR family oxidoreductase [Smithellaceae bacterium]
MKHILITGATSGIGRTCAEHLAAQGYAVIATGRNQQALDELEDKAAKGNWHLHTLKLDITNKEDVTAAAAQALKLTGGKGIDVLVNNAGYGQVGFLADLSNDQIRGQYDVNIFGMLAVTKAFLPQLVTNRAMVINIGSMMSRLSSPWSGLYATTKAAIRALSDVMRVEFGVLGVRVFLIEPGAIKTDFHHKAISSLDRIDQDNSYYAPTHRWMKENDYSPFFAMAEIEPVRIAQLVEQIVAGKKRKSRYIIPFMARVIMTFNQLMPVKIMDYAMRKTFHLFASGRN